MSQIATYRIDEATTVKFEVEPIDGFTPAGVGSIAGRVGEAAGPAIEAAKAVLDRARELSPDGVQVKFGVKVTGTANWLVARCATEGSFEVTLSWAGEKSGDSPTSDA
ncbi:CU044_2847 family protein [Dactylosporangium matsuzakiense]|uniref:Trypsin-co-occurring domain-containing protein n=1 Tax=Dactylosporangium matsuzakiense TaxID=53360 RepID=A0A9W6KTZ4_9ACTN|nr:CU044_2847 family protein [Dactylosporangium matsuzakiense]UWZ42404.1 hypothetical protein Dmats_33220 [Dactylosporangium matsuzakiense]GLL07613.1 hypothetical protein GCM10017581_093670 [Dactylosporangium matsuzakiense]